MWYFARICAHTRSWREFAKCRFAHYPSFFSIHVYTYDIVITLAMMGMSLRGHREHVGNGDCYGGNFLALVAMQARFDTFLRDMGPYACLTPGSNSEISEHDNPSREVFIQMPDRGPK